MDQNRRSFLQTIGVGLSSTVVGIGFGFGNVESQENDENWIMRGYNLSNTRYAPNNSGPIEQPGINWSLEVDHDGVNINEGAPVVNNGVVYYGSYDNNLYAIEQNSGQQIWSFDTKLNVTSTPSIENGVVYIIANEEDNHARDRSYVYAINSNSGEKIWDFEFSEELGPSPVMSESILYVSTHDGGVFAIDGDTGQTEWKVDLGRNSVRTPAIENNQIFLSSATGGYHEPV